MGSEERQSKKTAKKFDIRKTNLRYIVVLHNDNRKTFFRAIHVHTKTPTRYYNSSFRISETTQNIRFGTQI